MFCSRSTRAARVVARPLALRRGFATPAAKAPATPAAKTPAAKTPATPAAKTPATPAAPTARPVAAARSHKVVIVGAGTAGLSIGHQLLRSGKFAQDDIAIIDPAALHHYQPGWTLVGGGLKTKQELQRPLASGRSAVVLGSGKTLAYEQLVVVPGVQIDYASVKNLPEALADAGSRVSTIYGYETCDKVFGTIEALRAGTAIFTQPAGVIKCAGAPQKIMWLALDYWKRAGLYLYSRDAASSPIKIAFATGLPVMFGVPKYSARLEALRTERGVEGLFEHDLVSIEGSTATFSRASNEKEKVTRKFDLLHVTPKMGPHGFVRRSAVANAAGYVDVDDATLQHRRYANVWSAGDASSLPTSKTAAAVTAQAPVLVRNVLAALADKTADKTKTAEAGYDGYTSCPLLTEYGKVLLAEFKYGGVPQETFGDWLGIDQAEPRRAFYHLKKDFFPWVYYEHMVKGTWGGPKGWL